MQSSPKKPLDAVHMTKKVVDIVEFTFKPDKHHTDTNLCPSCTILVVNAKAFKGHNSVSFTFFVVTESL